MALTLSFPVRVTGSRDYCVLNDRNLDYLIETKNIWTQTVVIYFLNHCNFLFDMIIDNNCIIAGKKERKSLTTHRKKF